MASEQTPKSPDGDENREPQSNFESAADPAETSAAGADTAGDADVFTEPESKESPVTEPADAVPPVTMQQVSGRAWLLRIGVQSAAIVAVGALLLFLIGVAQRTQWITSDGFAANGSSVETGADGGDGSQRYICPMMCTPPTSQPGRCPVCGMKLVQVTNSGGGDGKSITIDPAARRLIGIKTAVSKMGSVSRTIRTIGSIDFDESRLSTISAYFDGRLEQMYADYVGVRVSERDDLALVYSPQLYTAQTEFVTSLDRKPIGRFDLGDGDLVAMAEEKLSELGMTADQIEDLRKTRKPRSRIRIKSPQSGTVIEKSAVEGDYVKTGQKLYRIADLATVWLMLDLFPDDAAAVRFGQEVEAEVQSAQGEVFTGRVAFINPTVDARTRTVRVRVEVMNPNGKLRPGDYATARISVPAIPTETVYDPLLAGKYISPMHPQVIRDQPGPCPLCGMDLIPTTELGFAEEPLPEQTVVTVPRDAVLLAGANGVLYVETDPGRFEIRRVSVGPMSDDRAVIIEGLAAGERVATGGNFLIDSQMQLAGNPSLLDPSGAPRFSPGPLELAENDPQPLLGESGVQFDRAYNAYFQIQKSMAEDTKPASVAINTLIDALSTLVQREDVPSDAQRQLGRAKRAAEQMGDSLETARDAFRSVSQAMLRAAVVARGPKTAAALTHYHCPMVPGDGGDWMQPGGELLNPYWGSAMLNCGEVVQDLALIDPSSNTPEAQD